MMNVISRPMSQTNDLNRILEFTYQHLDQCFHVVDLPYRLCSLAAQDRQNVQLWENEQGEVVGFCVVQLPFSTIDWAVQPGYAHLADEIVQWATGRLENISKLREDSFGFLLDSRSEPDATALKYGFTVDDWYMRNLVLALTQPIDVPAMPPSFTIRSLRSSESSDYVTLHRAAFNTRNMSDEWRERTLMHPLYTSNLDLVVEDEQGRLVAFCIGWMCEINGERIGQIEPLGVLPEFQQRGLGRATLLENLRRMREQGVSKVLIDAESYNPASQHLYESVGFREISRVVKYFRGF